MDRATHATGTATGTTTGTGRSLLAMIHLNHVSANREI